MLDKEERIYISYYKNNPCENCGKDYCAEGTCFCDIEFARSIPVTEAIEVMAKALCCDPSGGSCQHCIGLEREIFCEFEFKRNKHKAEVALKALLGGDGK